MATCIYGFRVMDTVSDDRKLVDWPVAFAAFASLDSRCELPRQQYLSAYVFPSDFGDYMRSNQTPRGYSGSCWSRWLWFDVDHEQDAEAALNDARHLVVYLAERYTVKEELLIWFSGSKGYHIGLPTSLWGPDASPLFARTCRLFAEQLAGLGGLPIIQTTNGKTRGGLDLSIYDRQRLFRAPNSRHAKTGLYKRFLTVDDLMALTVGEIRTRAGAPAAFDIPVDPALHSQAVDDWKEACDNVTKEIEVVRPAGVPPDRLNRLTLEFIRNGACIGSRHPTLYSAARNLAEFGCTFELALALLEPPARESGLCPADIRRQVRCGLDDQLKMGGTP